MIYQIYNLIKFFDITGKQVAILQSGFQTPGYHKINWDGSNHPSSLYLLQLKAGDFIEAQKVLVLKSCQKKFSRSFST